MSNHSQQSLDKNLLAPVSMPAETIILGFTGSLGSGCTYISQEVACQQGFLHYELSTPIRLKAAEDGDETYEHKQTIGNELRRVEGESCLAKKAIEHADQEWSTKPRNGLVLAGIRNEGEIKLLRQYPNFFLLSIHADKKVRFSRLQRAGRISDWSEFKKADSRDSDDSTSYGQQVKRCNYVADIIFNNDDEIPPTATGRKEEYVREGVVSRYVRLIQKTIASEDAYEYPPSANEAFMTMAYCESARSACLKRKVGAVIANVRTDDNGREHGYIVSSGFNDVPEGQAPCVFADGLYGCARDKWQEEYANRLAHCPDCGSAVSKEFRCEHCKRLLDKYVKVCPWCHKDPGIEYLCQNADCGADLYRKFIPGGGENGGKLLDICRSLHAEENAIIRLARGATVIGDDTVLYTTTFPCSLCANKIAEVGIKRVVFAEPYPMREAAETLEKRGVKVDKFEGVKSSAFFRLYH
jgi:deoxycytidylate deaminase